MRRKEDTMDLPEEQEKGGGSELGQERQRGIKVWMFGMVCFYYLF